MSDSIMDTEKRCYITHRHDNLHKHHVFYGTANRSISEKWGCWCWLNADYHNMSEFGVHGKNGHELDMMLKRECQVKFEAIHGHDKFMQIFKKNYL